MEDLDPQTQQLTNEIKKALNENMNNKNDPRANLLYSLKKKNFGHIKNLKDTTLNSFQTTWKNHLMVH